VDVERRRAAALARLYDLDLAEEPGDLDLYRALAQRVGGPVIELAVGTGRLALPLAEDGHLVVGVDNDPAMLERARGRAATAEAAGADRVRWVEGDLLNAARLDAVAAQAPFRLAFIALNSILLLASRERQRTALLALSDLLAPDGLAVVDAWQPSPGDLVSFDGRLSLEWLRTDPESGHEVTKSVAAWYDPSAHLVTLTTIFEEGAPGAAPARWTRTDALRLVTADELVAFAEAAGLAVDQLAGSHDLEPYGPGSERAILVARKKG